MSTESRPHRHSDDPAAIGAAENMGTEDRMPAGAVFLRVETADRWPGATRLALGGLAAAALMAAIGLPPIDLHSPLHYMGIMDPFCGGTRAVRYAALGQWGLSWRYNPLGIPVLLVFAALTLRAGVGFGAGRWITIAVVWSRKRKALAITIVLILAVALEIRQQSISSLLMAH